MKIINKEEIYDMTNAVGRSIFVTLPKDPGVKPYELHRAISLVNPVTLSLAFSGIHFVVEVERETNNSLISLKTLQQEILHFQQR